MDEMDKFLEIFNFFNTESRRNRHYEQTNYQ